MDLRTQEGEGSGHGGVLVLQWELASIRIGLDDSASNMAAIRRIGFRWLHNDVRLDLLGNRTDPLGDRYLQ